MGNTLDDFFINFPEDFILTPWKSLRSFSMRNFLKTTIYLLLLVIWIVSIVILYVCVTNNQHGFLIVCFVIIFVIIFILQRVFLRLEDAIELTQGNRFFPELLFLTESLGQLLVLFRTVDGEIQWFTQPLEFALVGIVVAYFILKLIYTIRYKETVRIESLK